VNEQTSDRVTRDSYYFSDAKPHEYVAAKNISKTVWMDLYVDLWSESHQGETSPELVLQDIRARRQRMARAGIR
jgi:hypothetical protein